MSKKCDSYQPPMRFRLRSRPTPSHAACPDSSNWCWRCFLLRIPELVAIILLFICLSSLAIGGVPRSPALFNPTSFDESGQPQPEFKVRIMGYWKEVRESLGLAPLPDTISWPLLLPYDSEASTLSGEPHQSLHDEINGSVGRACLVNTSKETQPTEPNDSEDRLLRLGRFNPRFRQWKDERNDTPVQKPCTDLEQPSLNAHNLSPESLQDPDSGDEPAPFTELTISPNSDMASQESSPPPLKVEALAASFRAIAARELRARAGVSHGMGGNYRMFRHLMS